MFRSMLKSVGGGSWLLWQLAASELNTWQLARWQFVTWQLVWWQLVGWQLAGHELKAIELPHFIYSIKY